jgi:hypothetical protein
MGRGRVSTQLIFRHLGVQTWGTDLSRQKNWGQGTKLCIVKQSHSQVCSGYYLSPGVPEKMLSLSSLEGRNLAPMRWLLLGQGAASSLQVIVLIWRGGLPCKSPLFLMGSFRPLSVVVFPGIQGDCKENGLEQKQIQNGVRDTKLLLSLVNLWVQVRSKGFSAKAV